MAAPTPTLINFSDTTPAPDSGFQNGKFRAGAAYQTQVTIGGIVQTAWVRDMSVECPNLGGINAQTGTSYTVAAEDRGKLVTLSNAGAIAVTLATLTAGFLCAVHNLGAGTATLTPSSGTINGGQNIELKSEQGGWLFFDGANWFAVLGGGGGGGGSWGSITGTLSDQTDLQNALNAKADAPIAIGDVTGLQSALDAKAPATRPALLVCYRRGKPGANEVILDVIPAAAMSFPAGLAGFTVRMSATPASTAVYRFSKNTVEFGRLSIATNGTPTWTSAAGASFNGTTDSLQITAPQTQDTTLSDVGICMKGLFA